jgi:hypothetical protein
MRSGLLLVLLGGCNQLLGVDPVKPVGPDAGDTGGSDTLHGTSTITWLHPSADPTSAPEDLRGYTIRALVRDPNATGGFRVIAGTGDAGGNFAVPVAPTPGTYLELTRPGALTHALYAIDRAAVDAGYVSLGHPGTAITSKTDVVLDLTGMTPWATSDNVVLASYAGGAYRDLLFSWMLTNLPAAGATSTPDTTFDWSTALVVDPGGPARALDAAAGDELTVAHTQTFDAVDTAMNKASLTRIVDRVVLPNVAMQDGGTTKLTGAFAAVAADHTQDFAVDLGSWFGVDPARTAATVMCDRFDEPAASFGLPFGIATWHLSVPMTPATPMRAWKSLAYADPFPGAWPGMIRCDAWQNATVMAGSAPLFFVVHSIVDLPAGRNVTAQPTLAVPGHATFGGADFAQGGTVVAGGKPITIAWSAAPWATQYHLDVRRYVPSAQPPVEVIATVDTAATSVDLPLDVITPGSYYIVSLWSVKATGGLPEGQLRRQGAFGERAQLLSKAFLVQ